MTTIGIREEIKEKLLEFKELKKCGTYSETINLLLETHPSYQEILKKKEELNISNLTFF